MTQLFFLVLLTCIIVLLLRTLNRPARIFEYPYFMAFGFAVFIAPQAWILTRYPGGIKDSSVDNVLLMTTLCVAACWFGYQRPPSKALSRWVGHPVNLERLFHVGVIYNLIALVLTAKFGTIDVEYTEKGGMTGIGTILLFFIQLSQPGFAICYFCALKRPSVTHVVAALLSAVPLLEVVLYGRREPTALFALVVGTGLFFIRNIRPSRLMIVASVCFALIAIPMTGAYRSQVAGRESNNVRELNIEENVEEFFTTEGILELRNAAAVMEATQSSREFQLGRAYWNHLVFRFVPAQVIGADFKGRLMFQINDVGEGAQVTEDYAVPNGSTLTGMGDSFQQFGWFGCLFFVFPAVFYRSIWQASRQGHLYAQIVYATTIPSAMRAVTHWTLDFLPGILYFLIFLELARLYAKMPSTRPLTSPISTGAARSLM